VQGRKTISALLVVAAICGLALGFHTRGREAVAWIMARVHHQKTVSDRVHEYGAVVRARLQPQFERAGVPYPPKLLTLVALKEERRLEVYAAASSQKPAFITSYPILAASGRLGPKLREGDLQVPEGIYGIESLNPNSLYHLALRIDYPNEFDHSHAQAEGRTTLGGDIMIHGSDGSVGCLAMGDETAEDLFVLSALAGIKNVQVIVAPVDLRVRKAPAPIKPPPSWLPELYRLIEAALREYPKTPNQAMQRTAGRAAFPLSMTSTFNLQRRSSSPAVAGLGSH